MPSGLGSFDTVDKLKYSIKDRLAHDSKPVDVAPGVKKIVGQETMYYWVEVNGEIALGMEMLIRPQGLVVTLSGKDSKFRGRKPYASDLYTLVLKDNQKSLRLISDQSLSDEGYGIWKRLFNAGHKISVYDREAPGKNFTTLTSIEDMNQYFADDDTDFKRYQFVLSESGEMLAETRTHFHIRRHRELIPGLL